MTTDTTKLTRWAQTMLTDITRERDEARALLPMGEPVPERMTLPKWSTDRAITQGWTFNTYDPKVMMCWYNGMYYHVGETRPSGPHAAWSRTNWPMYATRRQALVALRAAKVAEFAKVLAGIDRQIAGEEVEP